MVQADLQEGRTRGVQSTPTIFVNGQMVQGALPFEQFQAMIEAELAALPTP